MNQLDKKIRYLESTQTNYHLQYTPVILSDSNDRYIENEVISRAERKLEWWYDSSASANDQLQYLKDNIELKLQRSPRIFLYIWVRTCDLTVKEGKYIKLKSKDNDTVRDLVKVYREIHAYLSDFPSVKLAFLEVPYYSIYHWNKYKDHPTPEQFIQDDFKLVSQIYQANSFIRETNILLRKYSPQINCDLENCRKDRWGHSRYTVNFAKFLKDGNHPGPTLGRLWVLRFCELSQRDCSTW